MTPKKMAPSVVKQVYIPIAMTDSVTVKGVVRGSGFLKGILEQDQKLQQHS